SSRSTSSGDTSPSMSTSISSPSAFLVFAGAAALATFLAGFAAAGLAVVDFLPAAGFFAVVFCVDELSSSSTSSAAVSAFLAESPFVVVVLAALAVGLERRVAVSAAATYALSQRSIMAARRANLGA